MSWACKLFALIALLPFAQVLGRESAALRRAAESQPRQVLIFDAGSSGTRIHVFNLLRGAEGALVPRIDMTVRDKQTKKIKPGLSSFAHDSDFAGAQKNIEQLLEFASLWVPASQRASTPALLKATAGLRAVRPAEKAEAILQRVRETLAKSEYLFEPEWADIIKGKEEAGLAWVAANYLQGTFEGISSSVKSLGVIEMGGGSTQVSFEAHSSDAARLAGDDRFVFTTLTGTPYYLYAHSYLGYGQDHAQAKMSTLMQSTEVEDPCYPVGYTRKSKDDSSVFFQGTGNAEACEGLIASRLLAPSETMAPGRYSDEIPLRGNFVATENFFYVRNKLKIPLDGSIAAMRESAQTGCETALKPSADEEAAMKAGSADPFKENSCFGLSYQVAMLQSLRAATLPGVRVEIARNIKGGDIDWAVGAALTHYIDSGMAQAVTDGLGMFQSIPLQLGIFLVFLLAAVGAARFFMGPSTCSKRVAEVSSAVGATTIGSTWMNVGGKQGQGKGSPAE